MYFQVNDGLVFRLELSALQGQDLSWFMFSEGGEIGLLENYWIGDVFSLTMTTGRVRSF